MSFHRKYADNKPLNDALIQHRLPHDKPSQPADFFRAGWFARDAKPARTGYVQVPMRLTRAMQDVLEEEGWQWSDLLAAAEAVNPEEYAAIERFESLDQLARAEKERPDDQDAIDTMRSES